MKKSIYLLPLAILILSSSCSKDKDATPTDFTLGSDPNKGFLFETLKIIEYPNATDPKPDFIVLAQVNSNGDVMSPFLSHPNYLQRFLLSNEFQSLAEAQEYFDTYTTPESGALQVVASNIRPFQVWLVKTNTGGYGKILVTKTRFGKNNEVAFAEITFKAARM